MEIFEQCLELERQFQEKNLLIVTFFNHKIDSETVPKIMELYQFSLNAYLESIAGAMERYYLAKSMQDKLTLLNTRDLYCEYIISSYGMVAQDTDDKQTQK